MKLHQLQSLVALCDTGSIRAAAKLLGLTQPTVTTRIAELELELGATLVNRTPFGTTLTPAGRLLMAHARQVHHQLKRAEEEVAHLTRGGKGPLSIGVSPLAAIDFVGPVLEPFRQLFPYSTVHIVEGLFLRVAAALREGAVDLVISPLPVGERGQRAFQFAELTAYPMYVVGRGGHALSGARSLAELTGAQWLAGATTSRRQTTVEEMFAEHGLPKPEIAVHADLVTQVQAALASTNLLGLLPRRLFEGWPGLSLQPFDIQEAIRPVRVGLIMRKGQQLSPQATVFAEMVREQAITVAARLAAERAPESAG